MPACNRPAMRANVSRETSTRTGSAPYSAQCMTNRRPSSDFFLVSPVQTPISRTIPKKSEKVVDSMGQYRHNNFCCFDVRRYLSWIEGLTTNQYVGGSNPSRRTILDRSEQNRSRLERFFFCQAKERNVLEGSKIETSQYVDFRLLASARSSEGTTAEHHPSPWASSRLISQSQRLAHAAPFRCADAYRTEEHACSIFLK